MNRRIVLETAMADKVLVDNMVALDRDNTSPADVVDKESNSLEHTLDNAVDAQVYHRGLEVLVDHICMVVGGDQNLKTIKT